VDRQGKRLIERRIGAAVGLQSKREVNRDGEYRLIGAPPCVRGFRDVPFRLSFLFSHRLGDNPARAKVLDWTPYRNSQQRDCLCNCIADITAWLYSGKPVLHLRIRFQHAVVAQETNKYTGSGAAFHWSLPSVISFDAAAARKSNRAHKEEQ
jgi:hypothetical protein